MGTTLDTGLRWAIALRATRQLRVAAECQNNGNDQATAKYHDNAQQQQGQDRKPGVHS